MKQEEIDQILTYTFPKKGNHKGSLCSNVKYFHRLLTDVYVKGRSVKDIAEEENVWPATIYIRLGKAIKLFHRIKEKTESAPSLSSPVTILNISERALNCLAHDGIETLGDLITWTPRSLANIKNFGKNSLTEIVDELAVLGLCLSKEPAPEDYETAKVRRRPYNQIDHEIFFRKYTSAFAEQHVNKNLFLIRRKYPTASICFSCEEAQQLRDQLCYWLGLPSSEVIDVIKEKEGKS